MKVKKTTFEMNIVLIQKATSLNVKYSPKLKHTSLFLK